MHNRTKHSAHSLLRRLLALSLSVCLLLGVLPLNVFADGEEEPVVQSEETITETPTEAPTNPPTQPPTEAPAAPPAEPEPTAAPTVAPTEPEPTAAPTESPTEPETTAASTEPTEPSEVVVYTVTFYNKRTNASDEPLELEAKAGDLLADLLADAAWADETLLADCTWYEKEDTARKTPIDLEKTLVEGDMELCTYDERPRPMRPTRPLMQAAIARKTFTVTFHDIRSGTLVGTNQTVSATQGQTLSEVIAQQTIVEDPWFDKDGAEADTAAPVAADMELYTNAPAPRLTVTFHDQRTNEAAQEISVNAYADDTLANLMVDKAWGEVPLNTLDWYSDAAMTTQANLTTPIQENTNLYAGVQWNITVKTEGNRQTMTIPATVGDQRPTVDQFKNHTGKIWYTVQNGVITVVNFEKLVTDGVPEAMEAYTDITSAYTGLVSAGEREVKLYALQNRAKVSLLHKTLNAYVDGGGQVWVPVEDLESALATQYAQWGMEWQPITPGRVYLAHSQRDTEKLMPYTAQVFENHVFTRLDSTTDAAEVYYFPHDSGIESGTEFDLSDHVAEKSVYSVTMEEPQKENQTTYYLGGTSVTVQLTETKTWIVKEDGITVATLAEGTAAYTIGSIEHSYVISARPDFQAISMPSEDETTKHLDFYVSRDGSWQKIASRDNLTIYRDNSTLDNGYVRKYVSAADLEDIYGDYQFKASDLEVGSSTDSLFAYQEGEIAVDTNTAIDHNSPVKEFGAEGSRQKYVPITSTAQTSDTVSVFYLPRKTQEPFPETLAIKDAQTFYTVKFHDVTAGSVEGKPTTVYALNGTTLADAMAGQVWGATSLNTLKWYTKNEEGEHTVIDPGATLVNGVMDVYASEWAITVQAVAGGRLKMTIPTTPDGFSLTLDAFQGFDTQYVWYTGDGDTRTPVNFQEFVTNGVPTEVIAYTDLGPAYDGMLPVLNTSVNFFVFFNGERVPVDTKTDVTRYAKSGRQYLTADLLVAMYGKYGFTADMMTPGTKYFPHADGKNQNTQKTIYSTPNGAIVQGDVGFSPVLTHGGACDIYYLPNQTLNGNGPWVDYTTDGFYTFTVTDPFHKVYTADDPLPTVTVNGETASITVENVEGITWECRNKNGQETPTVTENQDGTTTYTAPHNDPKHQYTLTPTFAEGEYVVTYQVNLPEDPLSPLYETPTIMGQQDSYTASVTGSTHTVLALNRSAYNYKKGKYIGEATFQDWQVLIGETVTGPPVAPGAPLPIDALKEQLDNANTRYITLKANWTTKIASIDYTRGPMVNFFVGLNATPQDAEQWAQPLKVEDFTQSVYTTNVGVNAPGSDTPILGGKEWNKVFNGKDNNGDKKIDDKDKIEMKLSAVHDMLVNNLSGGYTYNEKTYTIDFPTDEEVLHRIREYQVKKDWGHVKINGEDVPVKDLVAENFTIKWNHFFSSPDDGWHVNGIIVSKKSYMTVTKTFTGDTWTIDAVKPNFYIDVDLPEITNNKNEQVNQDAAYYRGGRLILDERWQKPDSGTYYVASHSPGSNTYTWTIPVDLYYRYRLTEVGEEYTPSGDSAHSEQVTGTSRYNISNSKLNGDTHGWQNYTESEGRGNVIATAGNPGLTVAFQNSYTPLDVITLLKQDFTTREPIEGVQFQLLDEDGTEIPLRTLGGNRYYPADMEGAEGLTGGTEAKYITTDANGLAYLKMNHEPNETRTFYLKELPLEGYKPLSMIEVEWGQEATSSAHILQASCAEDENETEDTNKMVIVDAPSLTLVVNNKTPHKTKVKVVKNWLDQENTEVELQLYRKVKDDPNARLVPVGTSVTLNNTIGWEKTFDNLPLYVDGKPVTYEVRELAIGDFKFSSEFPTGFQYYHVSFDYPVYEYKGEPHTHENINQITLEVKNSRHITGLHFRKVNTDHVGLKAEFKLYTPTDDFSLADPPPDTKDASTLGTETGQAEYLDDGTVVFRGIAPGNYYLNETAPPSGYELDDSLFAVHFDGMKVQVYKAVDGDWEPVDHNHIVNHLVAYVPVTIQKQVTGAIGDRGHPFQFTVTSTTGETPTKIESGEGYTLIGEDESQAKFSLKHNQSVTLYVKKGSTLTIRESDAAGYTMRIGEKEYENFTYEYPVPNEINPGTYKVTVTNNREPGDLDTGVALDALPYLLLLAIAIGGAVLLLRRRRRSM